MQPASRPRHCFPGSSGACTTSRPTVPKRCFPALGLQPQNSVCSPHVTTAVTPRPRHDHIGHTSATALCRHSSAPGLPAGRRQQPTCICAGGLLILFLHLGPATCLQTGAQCPLALPRTQPALQLLESHPAQEARPRSLSGVGLSATRDKHIHKESLTHWMNKCFFLGLHTWL
ncbi:hypothetical protein mRhiFer1_009718 [Rhinolophus ferrumequinum]|uniref:Uncharacterized protein n=1 Tax=Rhinolophus ferrumequinum TaxID=59479 RepID=A0A7J7ZCI7_RHIFE|nr:hypothetical protein mRhiFer1_009718 [Rhinolophus ferrumequinum]